MKRSAVVGWPFADAFLGLVVATLVVVVAPVDAANPSAPSKSCVVIENETRSSAARSARTSGSVAARCMFWKERRRRRRRRRGRWVEGEGEKEGEGEGKQEGGAGLGCWVLVVEANFGAVNDNLP